MLPHVLGFETTTTKKNKPIKQNYKSLRVPILPTSKLKPELLAAYIKSQTQIKKLKKCASPICRKRRRSHDRQRYFRPSKILLHHRGE